jgi:predicted small secreted protein
MSNAPALFPAAPMRVVITAALLLGGLNTAPMLVLALIHLAAPNTIDSPFGQALTMFPGLFASNPLAALKLFASQPVAVVTHVEAGTGLRVWEVYLHLLPLLVLSAAALYASRLMKLGLTGAAQIAPFAGGLVLLAVALNTIRVAACCTAPGWGPDVWLRGLALSPPLGGVDWGVLYPHIERFILPAQIFIAGAGVALIVVAAEYRREAGTAATNDQRERA